MNPARCAASCTLSVKSSVFFSCSGMPACPNRWLSATDAKVDTREPRNRMPSVFWHDGHLPSAAAFRSVGSVVRTGTHSSWWSGRFHSTSKVTGSSQATFSGVASASPAACKNARKRSLFARDSFHAFFTRSSNWLLAAPASAAPQPPRPQCRQNTAARNRSMSAPGLSSYHRKAATLSTKRIRCVTSRTHSCVSTCSKAWSPFPVRACESSATKADKAFRALSASPLSSALTQVGATALKLRVASSNAVVSAATATTSAVSGWCLSAALSSMGSSSSSVPSSKNAAVAAWTSCSYPTSRLSGISSSISESSGMRPVGTVSDSGTVPIHSAAVNRFSRTSADSVNEQPKMVSAKFNSSAAREPSPSVAEVATGATDPSGRPSRLMPSAMPSRRSSRATSVPCAPS